MSSGIAYAELHAHSYFSLLDASASPEALVARARELGLSALALTDHDSLAGAVRFWVAAKQAGLQPIFGVEITLDHDGADAHLTLLAETQQGYANLCSLITRAHLDGTAEGEVWPGKTPPRVTWEALDQHHAGLIVLSGCRRGPVAAALLRRQPARALAAAQRLLDICGRGQVWIELQQHDRPDDDRLVHHLTGLARALDVPCVATGNAHHASREQARLRDALIAVRYNQSLTQARRAGHLPLNHGDGLAAPGEMARKFARWPDALRNSAEVARRCNASLDFGAHRLPAFVPLDGLSEFEYLYTRCHERLTHRYPHLSPTVLKQLAHELDVIEQAGLSGYFLIVWDIVRFAREQGVRCQGRGSAANSIVAYLLGITNIDPLQHHLLFERFLSPDRHTMPDIDIDVAADRREEVIQYVYGKYGAEHTAMVCNVVTYHARSALRDLGKALEFPAPVIERLSRSMETNSPVQAAEQLLAQAGAGAPEGHPLKLLAGLMRQIDGCPRHLSIHTGGMLITGPPLSEVVPLERATMPGRVVCQWDKDSVEDAGLIKIDLLGLRTLGMIDEALGYIDPPPAIDALPLDDPAVYAMLQQADTIGTFQVESRAQQQMLPRLKPACFEDIVIEVAIVRPGPIQGGTVHPYLRRRAGEELVSYAHACLEPVLRETLGVLLFQEQATRMAVVAAGFAPGEADALRRALSRYDNGELTPALRAMGERFMAGAARNGIDAPSAEAAFKQMAGFAGYGLCKSHAASFALIAYQTVYLKHYHPAAFYCALLNQQPMGFYSPEVVLGDMRRHGVGLLPPDINCSDWRYRIEGNRLRAGLRAVHGLGEQGWARVEAARQAGPFADLADVCARTRLARDTIGDLIRAGALDSLGKRRDLLWQLGEVAYTADELSWTPAATMVDLPPLEALEQTGWEYELLGWSPGGNVMRHYRPALDHAGVASVAQAKQARAGRRMRVAGMTAIRQRPPTAKGILFLSLEDETGLLDVIVQPQIYERHRRVLREEMLLLVEGVMQQGSGATSLLASQVHPLVHPLAVSSE